jgi:4-hydroxy-3-methylbut-2-enyl diphosphate reductase
MSQQALNVLLCAPRGFCAGVTRAIDIVERALEIFGAPIYVRHQIVHNRHVVEGLRARGVVFVDELDQIPQTQAPVVFSAHGVASAVEADAAKRNLTVLDASCPLVKKVHHEAERYYERGYEVLLIGHAGHPEVIGILGRLPAGSVTVIADLAAAASFDPRNPARLACVTQTTLSVDDTAEILSLLRARFASIVQPKSADICYATTNRQKAVKLAASRVDAFVVIGSTTSSNSRRLRDVAQAAGCPRSLLIDDAAHMNWTALEGAKNLGLTSGASVPEALVEQFLDALSRRFYLTVRTVSAASEAGISFGLPRALESTR